MNISLLFSSHNLTLQFAAEELESYLLKINPLLSISKNQENAECKISLLADLEGKDSQYATLDDSYTIEINELSGSIRGSNPRSVLLGVYRYLYLLGCRFLRPGKEYEVIPTHSAIKSFSISTQCRADLRHRGICIEGADSLENIIAFIDWLPKLGYNSFFVQFEFPFVFMENWYHHKYNPLLEEEAFSSQNAIDFSNRIDAEIQKRGLLHHRVGHGWTARVLHSDSTSWDKSSSGISESKKEYAAMLNGERDFFKGVPINTNLCYSNPKVISAFSKNVVDYAKEHPQVDFLHIWLADMFNNHCECPLCKDELPTDQYVRILNQIDQELTANHLPTKIVFLLYQELLWPSSLEKLENPERFLLMFAPISRTFDSSFKERKEIAPLPPFQKNQISLPSSLEENLSFLNEWKKIFTGDSFDYDYPLGRAHYGDLGYVGIARTLYEDIHQLHALQLNGYMSCQELRCFLPNALPNYVMGLSLFDSSLSFDEIVEDYYKHAYGTAWSACFHYLDTLSTLCSCDYFNGIGDRTNPAIAENAKQALSHLHAFRPFLETYLTESHGIQHKFFKHLDYHFEYSILLLQALQYLANGDTVQTQTAWDAFLQYIRSNEIEYQGCLDVYRVIEVATNYTGFQI